MKLDETTTIIISFLKLVNDYGLRVKPGSRHERTTVYNNISIHILDLSLYDSAKRFYELIEDEVVLYDNELDDGSTSRCWCVPVYNVRDSHPQPIDLFVVPVAHGGSNLITEELCKDRDMAIELGRITAHIMNRMPEKLPLDSRNGLTTVSRPVARQIILPREWASVNSESLLLQIEVQFNSESS
ncbi:hypothetical protein yc1106_02015 [Curvularia clavata]|uniref:Uncharacterized protein n=1 Tax=Curvularia clavata TaxID=95742 RepID=A0A9Q8Z232_CURCL|nr:hypothetical protein yc1106_02015 [Curvularia clavata]